MRIDNKNYSKCNDFAQGLSDRIARRTDAWFADTPRDMSLLVGFGEGSGILAEMGWTGDPNALVNDAMGSVVCSAVIASRMGRGVSFSLHGAFYSGMQKRYHRRLRLSVIQDAVHSLDLLGLVEVEWGNPWQNDGQGKQSRLWARPLLLERAGAMWFERPRLREIIRLYDASGRMIRYDETSKTRAMRVNLREWNADLRSRKLAVTDPRVIPLDNGRILVSTKNEEEPGEYVVHLDQVEAYRRFKGDFSTVGRFFGPGYQSLAKAVRPSLTIDGEATGSADFGGSHIRQAYATVNADPGDGDVYALPSGGWDRKLVKAATNTCLNCTDGRKEAYFAIASDVAKRTHSTGQFLQADALRAIGRNHRIRAMEGRARLAALRVEYGVLPTQGPSSLLNDGTS